MRDKITGNSLVKWGLCKYVHGYWIMKDLDKRE